MTLAEFQNRSDFSKQNEIRRVLLLAFYYYRQRDTPSFSILEISEWMTTLGFARPNTARLRVNLKKSKLFVAAGKEKHRLHPTAIEALDTEFPDFVIKSEETISFDSIVPEDLLQKERGFVLSLIRQVNSAYENNIFDGCAVLMRRLLEILLILSYEEHGIDAAIKDASGNYKMLNPIIDDAKVNSALGLSRNTKESLDEFRKLGNFSAHKIYYNAKKKSIDLVSLDYRATIEELLYKSKLRT